MIIEEIAQRRDSTKVVQQYRRWQVIWLAAQGTWKAEAIARTVGIPQKTVHNWICRYNNQGPEAYVLKPRGGDRRRLLTDAQEQEILAPFAEPATRGEVVIINRFRPLVEASLGRKVGKGFPYRMVRRQTWRPVVPRPEHPKKNAQEQETFKKNFRT
jgi:transposase